VLAYVSGGAAWTNANAAALADPVAGESGNFSMSGYTVGGGLEWMFAPGWLVFSEYNYMDYGTRDVNLYATGLVVPGLGVPGALEDIIAMRIRSQEVIFGVNYKFNLASPVAGKY
jgi:outer membrane immunogenic protein